MFDLERYNFVLPDELIAKSPASPRDTSRLFVYDTASDTITLDKFFNLHKHLPQNAHLVFNDTKVVPARLWLKKETGGKIEVLLLMNEHRPKEKFFKGIVDRKIEVGAKLYFESGAYLEVVKQEEQFFFFKPSISVSELFTLMQKEGHTPIPPYIKGSTLTEKNLREKYQSIFAKHPASVAAPTASLHMSPRVLRHLEKRGDVHTTHITLHVGAGTFAPISQENFVSQKLFEEYCTIETRAANEINRALSIGNPIIPVGTTAMRTLESFASRYHNQYHVTPGEKATNIFIFPPYEFKIADGIITNFHIPCSSLLLLVDALLVHKNSKRGIMELYKIAIQEKFRFYSFGDSMLIK